MAFRGTTWSFLDTRPRGVAFDKRGRVLELQGHGAGCSTCVNCCAAGKAALRYSPREKIWSIENMCRFQSSVSMRTDHQELKSGYRSARCSSLRSRLASQGMLFLLASCCFFEFSSVALMVSVRRRYQYQGL